MREKYLIEEDSGEKLNRIEGSWHRLLFEEFCCRAQRQEAGAARGNGSEEFCCFRRGGALVCLEPGHSIRCQFQFSLFQTVVNYCILEASGLWCPKREELCLQEPTSVAVIAGHLVLLHVKLRKTLTGLTFH